MSDVSSKALPVEEIGAEPVVPVPVSEESTGHRGSRTPWTASRAILAVVLSFFISQIIAGALLGLYPLLRHWTTAKSNDWLANSVAAQFMYVFVTEALTLLVLWFFWRQYKSGVRAALGLARWPRWRDARLALVGVGVYFGLYLAVLAIVNAIVPVDTSKQQDVGFQSAHGVMALMFTFMSLVILPPLVEEITFRGFLFSGLRRKFGPIIGGLLVSLMFAAPHLLTGKGNGLLWVAAIDTFSLSVVLCYLREKTGALYSGMLIHAIKNGIAFVALFIFVS